MSGGFFKDASWTSLGWAADDIRRLIGILKERPDEAFKPIPYYEQRLADVGLKKEAEDPKLLKYETIAALQNTAFLLEKASAALRAADFLGAGDFNPDSYIAEIKDLERSFGDNWLGKLEEDARIEQAFDTPPDRDLAHVNTGK